MRVSLDARLVSRGLGIATFTRQLAYSLCWIWESKSSGSAPTARPEQIDGVGSNPRPYMLMDLATGRIEILGYISHEDLHGVLSEARALLYPSRAEGLGLPVIEAMAAGTPVITGLSPATREVGGTRR